MIKKTKKNLKTKLLPLGFALALPIGIFGGACFTQAPSMAASSTSYVNDYLEEVTFTNSSFDEIAGTYVSGNSLSGWNAIDTSSRASGMIIDVGSSFNNYRNSYYLNSNPSKSGSDNKIMMINSKTSSTDSDRMAKLGYRSNELTLKANSYYRLAVDAKTALDGNSGYSAYASVYIDGLRDADGKAVTLAYENINNTSWATYYFYIATGDKAQTVTFDLYLGSQTSSSTGVVFFDEAVLEQFAPNTFFTTAQAAGYEFVDTNTTTDTTAKKFLVEGLQGKDSNLNLTDYNFDFEAPIDSLNTLGDAWKISQNSLDGHARIMPIHRDIQPSYFKEITGYEFVGNDLSYNTKTKKANQQALVLYTDKAATIAVQSKDIDIKAHGLYKISMKVKVSTIESGSFYLTVKENDTIYSRYEINEDSYTLQSKTNSGLTSNEENPFTNDYTEVNFYVKGHPFFDTSINLELSLGNGDTGAKGCVIVDDIRISYINNETFSAASDSLEFKSFTADPSFTNGYFNMTENEEAKLEYPLKAANWTLTQDEKNKTQLNAGVLYLKDSATYNEMYQNYAWAASYPGNPDSIDSPNNVYMMHNGNLSYQSVKSDAYTLSANSYYKLAFNYKTINTNASKDATIGIEIIDENGIKLFYKDGLKASAWDTEEIYFHTATSTSNKINVIIHFGKDTVEKKDLTIGYVYLDNFEVSTTSQTIFADATNKVDLTDYFMNLDPDGTIGYDLSTSSAYSFAIDKDYSLSPVTNAAKGGIVSGKENEFGITVDDSNLLVISAATKSKSTLTSTYKMDLEEGNYYKMTFDLRTIFNVDEDKLKENEKEHPCHYGVSVGLSGYDLATELKSNKDFTNYTIYFKANATGSQTFTFTLDADCDDTVGSAYLTHIAFESSTEDEYTAASTSEKYKETIFTSTATDAENGGDNGGGDNDNNGGNESENTGDSSKWLLIPSIIMALAIIVAIVGFTLRHVKIKKIEKIRQESYDKKVNINRDLVLLKAQKQRDAEAEALRNAIADLDAEKERLEAEHKEAIREARKTSNGKISKETEKEFKAYAAKMNRCAEKHEILKEQLDHTLTADYLISVEKRIAIEEERKLREIEKFQAGKLKQKAEKLKANENQSKNQSEKEKK